MHGVPSERHTPRVEAILQEEVSTSTVAIRTRAAEGSQAFGGGAEGNEFGNCKPSVSSEEAAGGFNPAAAGAEEAGLPLCDCCESPITAAELITYHVLKCVPGEEAVPLQYFCPICFVLVVRGCTEYCELLARQYPEGEIFGDTRFVPLLEEGGYLAPSTSAELSSELSAAYQAALFWFELAQRIPSPEGMFSRTPVQIFEAARVINDRKVRHPALLIPDIVTFVQSFGN